VIPSNPALPSPDPGDPGELRKIIHVDMDAFYASVEQRDNPALRGRPLAVGGAGERGVVAAASYEARPYGVRSAMSSAAARRRCPDLVFVPPRFDHYRAISRQVRAIFADYTPLVEPLALDEAYLDVTEDRRGLPTATRVAQEIRARIRAELGLTASAGVSYNKFLAKLASDHNKPDGLCVITPAQGPAFVAALDVAKFHGVGPVTAARMRAFGILTGADLRAQSRAFLRARFGKAGDYYFAAARGIDPRPVRADRPRKSVGSETTFPHDLTRADDLAEALRGQAARVWEHCAGAALVGKTVTLKLRYADFRQITRSRTVATPVASGPALDGVGQELLAAVLPVRMGVRLIGLSMSNLAAVDEHPLTQLALL
jgi:DNA polymerase-4